MPQSYTEPCAPLDGIRILLIDENPEDRASAVNALQRENKNVSVTKAERVSALQVLDASAFDVVKASGRRSMSRTLGL